MAMPIFGARAFSIAASQARNQLPADTCNTATHSSSKYHLKSFLFTVAHGLSILSYSFLGFVIHFLYSYTVCYVFNC